MKSAFFRNLKTIDTMRKLLILFILGVAAYFAVIDARTPPRAEQHAVSAVAEQRAAPSSIERGVSRTHPTFDTADNGKQVMTQGTVCRILDDDNDGRRHQRFLIELKSGQTILIAHNIDLASRVAPLAVGDVVLVNGQYEFNDKGGVIHWTHRDPKGRHQHGWIKRGSDIFQ